MIIRLPKFIFFLCVIIPFNLYAQNKTSEEEILFTGKYYYGKAIGKDSVHVCIYARENLMAQISDSLNNNLTLKANTDLFINNIRYFFMPVENLIEIIAFVDKKEVKNIIDNKKGFDIRELKYKKDEIYPEIKFNNEIELSNKKQISNGSKINIPQNSQNEPKSILDRLIELNTIDVLMKFLKVEEGKNKLIFNWDSKIYQRKVSPENFYIVLLNENNTVKAILDKGNDIRQDLKNPEKFYSQNEYSKMTQIWIQIF